MRTEKEVLDVFGKELAAFETTGTGIRDFTKKIICCMPDYFLERNNGKDNCILIHTKSCMVIAEELFKLECFREKFQVSERDCIRSALLLQDAMLYGAGEVHERLHEHPEYISIFIQSNKWEELLPAFLRKEIAEMVAAHEGQWNKSGEEDLKLLKPETECQIFVHMCSRLVKRPECTTQLPVVEQSYRELYDEMMHFRMESERLSSNVADIASALVEGQDWDGLVKKDSYGKFIILNGMRVTITDSLANALDHLSVNRISVKRNFTNPYGK